jgi:hypothetical protein
VARSAAPVVGARAAKPALVWAIMLALAGALILAAFGLASSAAADDVTVDVSIAPVPSGYETEEDYTGPPTTSDSAAPPPSTTPPTVSTTQPTTSAKPTATPDDDLPRTGAYAATGALIALLLAAFGAGLIRAKTRRLSTG